MMVTIGIPMLFGVEASVYADPATGNIYKDSLPIFIGENPVKAEIDFLLDG